MCYLNKGESFGLIVFLWMEEGGGVFWIMQLPIHCKQKMVTFLWNHHQFVLLVGPLNNMGLEMLSSMFGGLGAGSLTVPNRSNG